MGLIDAAFDSIGGVLSDQWKDIITCKSFDEHSLVVPGYRKRSQDGLGANFGAEDVLSNGSVIFVPENTAAIVLSQSGIEKIITKPGGYEYRDGVTSVFDEQDRRNQGIGKIILGQAADRFGFSGMSSEEKRVAFLNLREIRDIKYGTRGPLVYNDLFYGTDLEIYAFGSFTVQVVDPVTCVRNFVPAGVSNYSFDMPSVRRQIRTEFLHSLMVATNALSSKFRISQLPSQADDIVAEIHADSSNAGTWEQRFGIRLISAAIEHIELSDESRELIHGFSERKMNVRAFEDVSQHAANVAAQQIIAQGVRDNGLGDAGGMLFGMNMAQGINPQNASFVQPVPQSTDSTVSSSNVEPPLAKSEESATSSQAADKSSPTMALSLDEQIEMLQKLKKLVDSGILTKDEFEIKKRQILGV